MESIIKMWTLFEEESAKIDKEDTLKKLDTKEEKEYFEKLFDWTQEELFCFLRLAAFCILWLVYIIHFTLALFDLVKYNHYHFIRMMAFYRTADWIKAFILAPFGSLVILYYIFKYIFEEV